MGRNAAITVELEHIPLQRIVPNDKNPRGPYVAERDDEFQYLVDSVREFGVLVPIIVNYRDDDTYLLIDGERRYNAAKEANSPTIPAHVFYGEIDDDTFYRQMFHIHQTRKQWSAAQQCKASEELYRRLVAECGAEDFERLAERFSDRTGTTLRTARNRVSFLCQPDDVKTQVYSEDEGYWYVVEVEEKIVRPAMANYPEYFEVVKVDDVRRFLYRKYKAGLVRAAVEVRPAKVVASYRVSEAERDEAKAILERLILEPDYLFVEARDDFVRKFPQAAGEAPPITPSKLVGLMQDITDHLESYSPAHVKGSTGHYSVNPDVFKLALQDLVEAASGLLDQFDRP
ncbi:MAG: ParB N-terminal domain-containing protein [Dehalococcoidia bacterium]